MAPVMYLVIPTKISHISSITYDQLILSKMVKIIATRCHILRVKCTKFNFGWGSVPDPAGGAHDKEGEGGERGKRKKRGAWTRERKEGRKREGINLPHGRLKTFSRSELKMNWKKLVQGQVIYHLNRHSELYKNIP